MRDLLNLNRALVALALCAAIAAPLQAAAQESEAAEITTLPQALDIAQRYDFGDNGDAMEFIRERVLEVQRNPVARNELANTLAALLDDAESTYAFKLFVCKQLYIIGGEEQVAALAPLLADFELAHVARYALEVIPGEPVNDALWAAAESAPGPVAAGIATTLAARGGASALSRLAILAEHAEPEVVRAAVVGLGKLGGEQAESALKIALLASPDNVKTEIYEALLACAERYLEDGNTDGAGRLYEELLADSVPDFVRLAAFDGLVDIHGEQATPRIVAFLNSGEPEWVRAAMGYVRTVGGPQSTALFAAQLAAASPEVQVLLVGALADRGDPIALDTVIGGLNSPEEAVRHATIDALGQLGNETTVLPLLNVASSSDAEAAKRARDSLVRLPDAGVNGALLGAFDQAPPESKALVAGILADRRAREAVPVLLDAVEGQSGDTRRAIYAAIGNLAGQNTVPRLAALFYNAVDEKARTEASGAITEVLRRVPPSEARTTTLTSLYSSAPSSVARSSLLAMFRDLGDSTVLPVVEEAVKSDDAIIQDAAVTALAGWPDARPLEAVYALASGSGTEAHKRAALEGYIRMLRLESDRPDGETVAGFKRALALSEDPAVVRTVLAGLSERRSTEALDVVEGYLGHESVHAEAAVAAEKIRSAHYTATASVAPDAAQNAIDGNIYSFWETPGPQEPGQWIEIDMFRRAAIKGVVIDTSRTKTGFPRTYSIYVYEKGGQPGEPVAVGEGTEGVTQVEFVRPVSGQMLRIEQTGSTGELSWVIHEVRVIPE